MNIAESWYTGYGDLPFFGGNSPHPNLVHQGAAGVRKEFPKLDFIQGCKAFPFGLQEEVAQEDHNDGVKNSAKPILPTLHHDQLPERTISPQNYPLVVLSILFFLGLAMLAHKYLKREDKKTQSRQL